MPYASYYARARHAGTALAIYAGDPRLVSDTGTQLNNKRGGLDGDHRTRLAAGSTDLESEVRRRSTAWVPGGDRVLNKKIWNGLGALVAPEFGTSDIPPPKSAGLRIARPADAFREWAPTAGHHLIEQMRRGILLFANGSPRKSQRVTSGIAETRTGPAVHARSDSNASLLLYPSRRFLRLGPAGEYPCRAIIDRFIGGH